LISTHVFLHYENFSTLPPILYISINAGITIGNSEHDKIAVFTF